MRNIRHLLRLSFGVLILLLSTLVGYGSSAEITTFSDQKFVRTTGAPNFYKNTFPAEPGEAVLTIKNGEPGEKNNSNYRITSGVVSLNGKVLFDHNDFKHGTYILEIPVTLKETNELTVELESKPENYISLEIIQTVPDPVYDLLSSNLEVNTEQCPDAVEISLEVVNTGEDTIPAGVQIAFYAGSPDDEGTFIGSTVTSTDLDALETENIVYQWVGPSVENAVIYANVDDDGTGKGGYEETDETNNLVSFEASLCIIVPGDSSVSGHIINAVTGEKLSGVTTQLHVDENGVPGAVVASQESGENGLYHYSNIAAGSYFISAFHVGYIDNHRLVALNANSHLTDLDIPLSPVLAENEIRIILTWNSSPADLEAHLTAPSDSGCRYHCYYFNKDIPTANLDLDDRDGFGPETITITDKVSGTYRYYVHDFTNRYRNGRWLSYSGATVKVFYGDREPTVFTVPYGYGNVWHVFDMDGETGEITPVDVLTNQQEPGKIDYPVITSGTPYRYAYWRSTYKYQTRAVDPDNDTLTYSLENAPAGMTIDPDTGLVTWTPSGNQMGWYYNIRIKVEDGRCGEAIKTFRIHVNSQPIIDFSVSPCSGVNPGGDITLTWSTTRATSVLIDQGIGEVPVSGTLTIPSPEVPTLYTLTAINDAALLKRNVPKAPGATFYFNPRTINAGQSTKLYWNAQCSTSRSISHGIGSVPVSGFKELTPTQSGYYNIYPTNAGGTTSRRAYISVRYPQEYFTISPQCNMTPGEPMTLAWHINNASSVSISPDVGPVEATGTYIVYPEQSGSYTLTATVNGQIVKRYVSFPSYPSINTNPYSSRGIEPGQSVRISYSSGCTDTVTVNQGIGAVPTNGYITVTPESLPKTYTFTATNERGSRSRSIYIYQLKPQLSVTPYRVYMDLGEYVTIKWTSRYADTVTISPDIGEVLLNGSITVAPDSLPKTYTVTAINSAGSTIRRVYLIPIDPQGTLSASPSIVKVGDSTRLTWTSSRATSCSISPDIGQVALNGSMVITPAKPTRYRLAAIGTTSTHYSYVNVGFVYPVADLKASATTINQGETVKLTWVYANATSSVINQGIGEVELGGERIVAPATTTTYTMTANGPGGTAKDSITITVIPQGQPPIISLSASPQNILPGGSSVLTWDASYTDALTIEPNIGPVANAGSITVTPEITTTYVATATGSGGMIIQRAMVNVVHPAPALTLSADVTNIMAGESATLTWTTSDAEAVTIDQELGEVPLQGTLTVSPDTTTLYTVTATGPGGTVSRNISITVTQPTPVVTFSATPSSIELGESTNLGWQTENAETVTIKPNIGTVEANGSISVSPSENTTYYITATGLGTSVTEQVTVQVVYPLPTASLTAEPAEINLGQSTILSWSSEYGRSCSITPDIGLVNCSGQISVSPEDETLYILSVTGYGGTTNSQATVTVIHPQPTVSLSATPSEISVGESTVLTWATEYAKTCSIEPGLSTVDCNGEQAVTPSQDTTYTLTATGTGGTTTVEAAVRVSPIMLTITSPTDGSTMFRKNIMVTGTVSHRNGLETGVVVNGVTALVYDGQFVANHVPLAEVANTITVIGIDVNGKTAEKSVSLTASYPAHSIELSLDTEMGIAPLETELQYTTNFTPASSPTFTYIGPADLGFAAGEEPDSWNVTANEPGIYTFFIEAFDNLGDTHTDEIAFLAMEKTFLDNLLQAKWNSMKAAMAAGNIETAVSQFTYSQRETFRQIFNLQSDKLPQIAAEMQSIEFIHSKNETAEYRIKRELIFDGVTKLITFYIYFDREGDGVWRIRDF